MSKHELARIFNEIGLLLEIKEENPFKARAYYKAARTVENLDRELDELIREDRLKSIPGFGRAIVQKILEWRATGTIRYYEELKQLLPAGLFDLLRVPGLGPKKIATLYSTLKITDLEMLERACQQNQLLTLPGFGVKTQAKICAGIEFLKEHRQSFLWAVGMEWALKIREHLTAHPQVSQFEIAGDLRRYLPVSTQINLVAAANEPQLVTAFWSSPAFHQSLGLNAEAFTDRGGNTPSLVLPNGIKVDLTIVKPEAFPHTLLFLTGSAEHTAALQRLAQEKGLALEAEPLRKDQEYIDCRDEAEIYQKLGLSYIPPELRENQGEIEAAAAGNLPQLVTADDLQGIFHVHTTASDGISSLREQVEASIAAGFKYLGIADHSRSAFYAHGLNNDALARQWTEIDRLNKEYPNFTILKGIEADILPSGELDYDPETLAKFDFVIGSIHSQFRMTESEMTSRILKAMDNPFLTMLGHPTGRILLERPAYAIDLEAVIDKAARTGVILEFNANPYRLDLDWQWCRRAKQKGVLIAINPDAHSTSELELVRSGVLFARKGWLTKEDVFNTRSAQEILAYLKKRRDRS